MSPSAVQVNPGHSALDLVAISKPDGHVSADTVFLSIISKHPIATKTWKRLVCYTLAEVHPKNTSIQHLIRQSETVLGYVESADTKIYHALRIGRRWRDIVSWASGESDRPLTGIILVLTNGYIWERHAKISCQTALDKLLGKSNILHQAKNYSILVDAVIPKIKAHLVFVPPPKYKIPSPNGCKRASQGILGRDAGSAIQQTISSIATAFEVIPNLKATSTDATHLIIILSFFANHEIPIELLCRGTSPRKRWSEDGQIIETYPADFGLLHNLIRICSSSEILMNTLSELRSFSAILWTSNLSFKLNETVRDRILSSFPARLQAFWARQAFTLVYRSIPWKYLEHMQPENSLVISHLRHALEGARRYRSFEDISPAGRIDMALSLIESSRFSNMEWKRLATRQAEELTIGLDDSYMDSCLVQRQCILHRLSGEIKGPFPFLPAVVPGHATVRLHAALGHTLIQGALNHVQTDELSKAIDLLKVWQPTSQQPSAMEHVVLFRQNLIFGKIFRYQGDFLKSLLCLNRSKNIAEATKVLVFSEDACELACNLADTYLELENPEKAEVCLRAEIKNQYTKQATIVALADALFAQKRFEEADTLCLSLQPSGKLRKMERLRLSIVQAKLSHVRARLDAAFSYWTEAMTNLRQFTLASGHTTSIILRSQCDVLRRQGFFDLERQSYEQLRTLEKCAGSDGALYWIAGLRQWLEYLETGSRSGPTCCE